MTAAASNRQPEPPYRVLAVDDDPIQLLLVAEVLEPPRHALCTAASGEEALALAATQEFDLVLLDRNMPGLSGDETCRRLRALPGLALLPVLMLTGSTAPGELAASLGAGASDFIRKPFLPLELQARVAAAALHKRATDQLDSAESLLFALARMVEAKDGCTGDHCGRLAHLSFELGRALGLPASQLLALRRGGVLHDIGKLGIPDAILTKRGALDAGEWTLMRRHTTIGADLLAGLRSLRETVPIVRHHHERWDGSGYPAGLAGEAIPLSGRIVAVVDFFDALTMDRVYRKAFPDAVALEMLRAERGRAFDPRLVDAFLAEADAMIGLRERVNRQRPSFADLMD